MIPKKNNKNKATPKVPDFPARLKPEEIIVEIETKIATQNPNYNLIHSSFLKEGPRAHKIAILYEVINHKTKEFHHYVLDIFSINKRKDGWFKSKDKFTLTGESNEIDALFKLLSVVNDNSLPKEEGSFHIVSDNDMHKVQQSIGDNIQDILEDPDSYKELLKRGGNDLLEMLINESPRGENIDLIVDFINSISDLNKPEKIQALEAIKNQNLTTNELNIISGRIEGLEEFKLQLSENKWNEPEWQKFFEANTWILGYGLDYNFLKILQREASVSNITLGGKESVNVDFLMGNKNFTFLVELKRPDTPLFKGAKNRSRSWKISDDLIDATTQILAQKAEWQLKASSPQFDRDGEQITQKTIDPKAILIIGKTTEFNGRNLENEIKAKTFELYRRNLKDIDIYTFDELFDRAQFIVSEKLKSNV